MMDAASFNSKANLNPIRLKFHGHNAATLANARQSKEQEFLLLSRESAPKICNALLLIDWDGDIAHRVGVASLKLNDVGLLERCKPERKLLRLK